MVEIRFDHADITSAIAYIRNAFANTSNLMQSIKDDFITPEIENIFDTDGYGTWDQTSRPNPILRDTLLLKDSIDDIIEIGNDTLSIDTDKSAATYHTYHEDSTPRFVARPVIGLLDDEDPRIEEIIEAWVDDVIRGAGLEP